MKKMRWLTYSILMIGLVHFYACGNEGKENESANGDSVTTEEFYDYDMAEAEYTECDGACDAAAEDDYFPGIAEEFNTEEYTYMEENDFLSPGTSPLSTFSIDVDNASYTNVRRMIEDGYMPPVDAVRTEEFVNYFDYDYPVPSKKDVFSVYTEVGECPWNEKNQLVHIGLKGYTIPTEELPPSNLVFLLDVSGSMDEENKLPLLKRSFKMLVDKLSIKDNVSIVTYAGDERLVLPSSSCANKTEIKNAIDNLSAGGSTNGEGGIEMAYKQALENFKENGNNRVILATDGDFNIGKSSGGELTRLIEEKRDAGVYLTILGFGMGNYKDSKMESLADHGNGNYFYIDDIKESNRVLVTNLAGTLFTIAKDVKIQVEFNPAHVKEYRLIGYENRLMEAEDFDNDQKDAGELGAGHTVTAIYEIVPGKAESSSLKYQSTKNNHSDEMVNIKLRYKKPNESKSNLIELAVDNQSKSWKETSDIFRFSAAVAGFSLILRNSKYIKDLNFEDIIGWARGATDLNSMENVAFIQLVQEAQLVAEAS